MKAITAVTKRFAKEKGIKDVALLTNGERLTKEASERLICELNLKAIGNISVGNDLDSCMEDADLLYTDCWPYAPDDEMKMNIKKHFLPYQITGAHLSRLNQNSIFLPCPPVTRGQEVSSDAMKSEFCMNYKAKEYLLHSQNAIIEMLNTGAF